MNKISDKAKLIVAIALIFVVAISVILIIILNKEDTSVPDNVDIETIGASAPQVQENQENIEVKPEEEIAKTRGDLVIMTEDVAKPVKDIDIVSSREEINKTGDKKSETRDVVEVITGENNGDQNMNIVVPSVVGNKIQQDTKIKLIEMRNFLTVSIINSGFEDMIRYANNRSDPRGESIDIRIVIQRMESSMESKRGYDYFIGLMENEIFRGITTKWKVVSEEIDKLFTNIKEKDITNRAEYNVDIQQLKEYIQEFNIELDNLKIYD